jgi:hypothetical protein
LQPGFHRFFALLSGHPLSREFGTHYFYAEDVQLVSRNQLLGKGQRRRGIREEVVEAAHVERMRRQAVGANEELALGEGGVLQPCVVGA